MFTVTYTDGSKANFSYKTKIVNPENVVKIIFWNSKFANLKGLEKCINLEELVCYNVNLTSLEGIENCVNLKNLMISRNRLTSLQGLENCINLTELRCSQNQLTSLQGLENCVNLEVIYCYGNNLTFLPDFITTFTKLKWFDYYQNPIVDIPEEIKNFIDKVPSLDNLDV